MKILLVDDNQVNCEVAIDMLEVLGYQADVAQDGEQALAMYDREKHGLILMDCEMPIFNGYETTEQIRAIENKLNQSRAPIIALTAHAVSGVKEKCMSSGMDDFLSKPFTLLKLKNIINKWFASNSNQTVANIDESDVIQSQDKVKIENSTDSNNPESLDQEIVERLSNRQKVNGGNLFITIVNVYLQQSSDLLSRIKDAVADNDINKIGEICHLLKSSSANVGSAYLTILCSQIEESAKLGVVDNGFIDDLIDSYPIVVKALNQAMAVSNK